MIVKLPSKYFLLSLLATIFSGVCSVSFQLWMGNLVLQLLAVAAAFAGGFFYAWFSLKGRPCYIDSSDPLTTAGILFVGAAATAIFLFFYGSSLKLTYGLIVYIWSLVLGGISASLYFKRLQSKGK